ncbi:hypothetical protein M378DRAFT_105538 [Amanita muscaria Koide BX008]|uniref:Uncharacterized protein n=1 Tax=Amanita muscaria (strain Koide BX008) TaxID=946122 RepID=A0A0C2TDV9_AMAMK|nr:hypothetical protein M378DRAFT_105538 [Amanita muscaria Koide BX008]
MTQTALLPTQVTPPRLWADSIEDAMLAAFKPFTKYITYLAEGKLDGYFDSIQSEKLITDLKVELPTQPMLLLHGLGENTNMEAINSLFTSDTVHLFAVSGAGKTRRTLEGLCHYWGFYISCRPHRGIGSNDLKSATKIMTTMSKWDGDKNGQNNIKNNTKNVDVANRAFAMLICARVFVLKHLLEHLTLDTEDMIARRRWILAQVMPPFPKFQDDDDMFTTIITSLRGAEEKDMLRLAGTMLRGMARIRGLLFAVVDEVQVAAEYLSDYFRSFTTGTDMRPVLDAFHTFLWRTRIFRGVILAGTGLSEMVKNVLLSQAAKSMGSRKYPTVSVELGRFTKDGTSHVDYIRKYLSLRSISDRRLEDRILYWFSGRYRFTASLIELLLYTQPGSPHRILSAFARSLTQFTITDAIDLEEGEPVLTPDTVDKISTFRELNTIDRLFEGRDQGCDQAQLIQCLFHAFMRWRIGSQTTSFPVKGNVHELITLGIGHLQEVEPSRTLDPKKNYPVYLCEPLVVLYLSSIFDKYPHTKKEAWIAEAFRTARDPQSGGIIFEEAVLLVLLERFGGKSCAFSDVFHCNQPWGSRKVTLVSLKRTADGSMQCYPVSWTSGSSDRLGFRAASPKDVLEFLNNPDGKCFLFPDTHMGPDLMCFLQDEETKELILVAVQARLIFPSLTVSDWLSAIETVTPEFFYTSNTKNGRVQYAPIKYPDVPDGITEALKTMLGPAEYKPVVDKCREKLRSFTALNKKFESKASRKTPKYLRIIAPIDAQQQWESESQGDVGVLRWELMKTYDVVMTGAPSVA